VVNRTLIRLSETGSIPTPDILAGTTQLFTASRSSSNILVDVLTEEVVHVVFTNFTLSNYDLSKPTFSGDITDLTSTAYFVGGTHGTLRVAEFNVIGNFTITASTRSDSQALLELTSLEAD